MPLQSLRSRKRIARAIRPTERPTLFFRCPWNLPDGFTRYWIRTWRGSGHVTTDLHETTRTGKRTN